METKARPWAIDEAVSDASIVATLLNIGTNLINELDFTLADGRKNHELEQLHGLLFAAEKLARDLVDEIDALPRAGGAQ